MTYTTQGTYTVTWTFDDGNGNTSTTTQTVVVDDVTPPSLPSLPPVMSQCSTTLVAPVATDNCAGTVTGTTSDPLTYTTQGTYTVTWTFDDGNGNAITATQTVVVDDVTPPSLPSLPPVTGECSVTVTAPTATDNCAGTVTGTTSDPLTYSTEGTYTVTWTFDDGNGNAITATQTVVVDDVTPPSLPSLPPVMSQCSTTLVAPVATDNCAGTVTGTTSDPLTYTTQGTYTVTWTFDDGNGNAITATQTVVVDDVTPPSLPSLPPVMSQCSTTLVAPVATDNCAGTVTGTTSDPLTYTTQGTYTVTWTFDDGNGNTVTATQSVTVDDVTPPVADVGTLPTLTDCNSITVTPPTATDNCAGSITGTTTDPLTYSTIGSYTVTWTYNDGNGNTSTQTQSVQIVDCSGLENEVITWNANVYPNPNNGQFTLSLSEMPRGNAVVRIITTLGQVVYTTNLTAPVMTFDLSALAGATYYLQIVAEDGVVTKQIIVRQ